MSIREWDEANDKSGWAVADTLRSLLARAGMASVEVTR
jgi:hypothetical protein